MTMMMTIAMAMEPLGNSDGDGKGEGGCQGGGEGDGGPRASGFFFQIGTPSPLDL
jgi:hypothetical protein